MNKKQDSNSKELVRFLITGLVCALADFLTTSLFLMILRKTPDAVKSSISLLAGFIVGVILNYILSTYWVFKGKQDAKVTKSAGFIIAFVLLSIVAYGLSYGTYELCRVIFWNTLQININEANISFIFQPKHWIEALFWLFVLAFFLKTLVGLIWNYFTRKYILYRKK